MLSRATTVGTVHHVTSEGDDYRVERDSMGEVRVHASVQWGAHTQRAVDNFPISGVPLESSLIAALARIKGAAAQANARLGVIEQDMADAISAAAAEVAEGRWAGHFPIDVFQTGSGTSSNMNVNEVLARLASERLGGPVHANDHVNASQSSNDVFPSAIHVAAAHQTQTVLLPALEYLCLALLAKARSFAEVVKSGRTHLMDATPVTLGQEFGGYAAQVSQAAGRIKATLGSVGELPLGGTAVGTGINCPPGFAANVIDQLARDLKLPLVEAGDHFAVQGARDALVALSSGLRGLAVALVKIGNDIRWMASGPRTGLAEIRLPDLQPGSSIMPGKVNPVLVEALTQVSAQVIGNDATVAFAGSQGNFELNVYMPVISRNLLESIRLLANVTRLFADRCVAGIEADVERCRAYAESSPSLGTSLTPYIGYDAAGVIVKESIATGRSVRELALEKGLLTEDQLDVALDVLGMTKGGVRK
jgi:fumarate hydratase, class II